MILKKEVMNNFQFTSIIDSQSDYFGVMASGLCMIHCLITPFIFVASVCTTSCCAEAPWWWTLVDYFFLIVSFVAIQYSAKSTSLRWMPTALYLSWGMLALLMIHERFPVREIPHVMIYIPALVLVSLHLYNRKYCTCDEGKCCVE